MSQNLTKPVLETTAPLGIGATFNGPPRATDGFSKFRALAFADQAGTVNLQQSFDGGTTWRTTDTTAIVAGTPKTIEGLIVAPLVRVQYVNGGVANTVFNLGVALVAI